MAAFKPHYTLCPLLGALNLVGVTADKDENTVLVTLGPNIIVKHKLSDQKPLKSWSTRQSNRLTCKAIYDAKNEKYVSVLNKKHICLWNEEDSNLEDLKKHTFSTSIHKLHPLPGKSPIVVYENGFSENLDNSLSRRKNEKPTLLHQDETLVKSYLECIKDRTVLILRTSLHKVYYVCLAADGTPERNLSFQLTWKSKDLKILATTIVNDNNLISVLVLWSNGDLVQFNEQGAVMASHNLREISLSSPVEMVMLDATHIAIYGADISEEGALLLLHDLKFGMNVAIRRLKFFSNPPHLYCLHSNNVLLICIAQNLVVVPFILQPSLLWNLLDDKQIPEAKVTPEVVAWTKETPLKGSESALCFQDVELTQLAKSLWESSASSAHLCDALLPPLKESGDLHGIRRLLTAIKDVPEKWLADLLNFTLDLGTEDVEQDVSALLNILFSTSYSDVILLEHLRRKLTTANTIKILHHLHDLLSDSAWWKSDVSGSRYKINDIVDWISLILDTHHHELLIASSDTTVKDLIQKLGHYVNESYEFLECLGQSESFVNLLEQNRKPPENRRKEWYAVEVIRLV